MKNIGIICEYNPFHNGHAYQLARVKEQGNAVCLMSGSYVQRGEPAVIRKLDRAEAAVRAGADLVLELPITYALRSAEGFADGGVEIFSRLGIMDALCFGSECGNIESLQTLARLMCSEEFSVLLKEKLAGGMSFPSARQQAAEELGLPGTILSNPNDILGVEYCKALYRRNSTIEPVIIKREGSYHESLSEEAPSASVLRGRSDWKDYMPLSAYELQNVSPRHYISAGERAMLARLRAMNDGEFEALPFGTEGLWRKLMHSCRQENSLADILAATKSKRYTHTRLMRMLMCAYLGIEEGLLTQSVPYVRVLAMNEQGGKLIRAIREQGDILLLHAGETAPDCAYSRLERRAEALYGLFSDEATEPPSGHESVRYCSF